MTAILLRTARPLARLLAGLALVAPSGLRAQDATPSSTTIPSAGARAISLADALALAESRSEALQVARAGAMRAQGQLLQARSALLPQVGTSGGYTRTLRSPFQRLNFGGGPPVDTTGPASVCAPRIPPNATAAERLAALAQASSCQAAMGGGVDFSRAGLGAENQYALGLNFSQNLFSGGRLQAQNAAARAGRRAADIEVAAQRAQLALDVTQAYYDAALATQLVRIAESTLAQTEEVLRQTRVARQVGNQSEFDLLRAQVTRDNQVPVLIAQRSARSTAFLRLKQLLDFPLDEEITLTTAVGDDATAPALPPFRGRDAATLGDTSVDARAPVRQLAENLEAQQALLRIARGERLPALQLTSAYQRLWFPRTGLPSWSEFAENWTVGLGFSVPLFTGGRLRGSELVARAGVEESQARLQQVRELAALDARIARDQLAQAEAALAASRGTAEQARRAYGIDEIRFREGISTQTDLAQSRILVQQATANQALAARDLAVARMRVALLRDLPLQLGAGGAGGASSGAQNGAQGAQQGGATGAAQQNARQQTAGAAGQMGSGAGGQFGNPTP